MNIDQWISKAYENHIEQHFHADFETCDSAFCQMARAAEIELAALRVTETALENLFQACSDICSDDMNKLEKEINAASAALRCAVYRKEIAMNIYQWIADVHAAHLRDCHVENFDVCENVVCQIVHAAEIAALRQRVAELEAEKAE